MSAYRGKSNDVEDGPSSYSSLSPSRDPRVWAFGREVMGRGAVGGGATDGRPGGKRGGEPDSLSSK